MATGDRTFIADKATLDAVKATTDTVNTNTADTRSKVGTTTDTGGSATAGTLMSKINAVLAWLFGTLWDSVAQLHTVADNTYAQAVNTLNVANSASVNTATNNTPSTMGTLSQKLSYIIQQLGTMGQKKLNSKQISFTTSATGTHTILEITGGGQFEFAQTSMGTSSAVLTFEIDGESIVFNTGTGTAGIGRVTLYPQNRLQRLANITDREYAALHPLHFASRLKITVAKSGGSEDFFHCQYSVYQ